MDDLKASTIASEYINDNIFRRKTIDDYLKSKQIGVEDWSLVLSKIAQIGMQKCRYKIKYFIENHLEILLLDENKLIMLLVSLANAEKEITSGSFYFLSNIPEKKGVDFALRVYERIKNSQFLSLKLSSGYLIGAIGTYSATTLFNEILEHEHDKKSTDEDKKLSYIIALKGAFYKNRNLHLPNFFVDFVIESTNSSKISLKNESIAACLYLYELDQNRFGSHLKSLVNQSDENKHIISFQLLVYDLSDSNLELSLLKNCSESDSVNIVGKVLETITAKIDRKNKPPEIVTEALHLLKKWSRLGQLFKLPAECLMEAICKVDIDMALRYLDEWINEEENEVPLHAIMPHLLLPLYADKEPDLVELLDHWKNRDQRYRTICLFAFKKILESITEFVDYKIYSAIVKVGQAREIIDKAYPNIDYKTESRRVEDSIPECVSILKQLEAKTENIKEKEQITSLISELSRFLKAYQTKIKTIDALVGVLINIAAEQGFDMDSLKKGIWKRAINEKVIECYKIIEVLDSERKSLECKMVAKNITHFANISRHLGPCLNQKCKDGNTDHPLLSWLSELDSEMADAAVDEKAEEIRYQIERHKRLRCLLGYLNSCLDILNRPNQRGNQTIQGLKNSDQFHQTFSELEIATALDRCFSTQLQEPINGKLADVIVHLTNDRRAIFEITSLDLRDKLKHIGFESNMGNKAKGIIIEKIRKQIGIYAQGNNDLTFLVIDKTRAPDISPEDIYHALVGSPGRLLLKDKETHEVVGTKVVRRPDAIGETEKDGDKLSAVILYNTSLSVETNSVGLEGTIFVNPYALVKADDSSLNDIESALFQRTV